MKRSIGYLMAIILVLFIAACGSKTDNRPAAEKDKILIGLSMCKQDENFVRMREFLEKHFAEFANPSVELVWTNAEDNMEKQLTDIDSLILRKPDAILIYPVDSEGAIPALEAVVKADIPACDAGYLINSTLQNVQILEFEELELGRLQGDYVNNWLKEHPDKNLVLGYIEGSQKNTAQLVRWVGFWERVSEEWGENNPRVKVVARQNAPTWSTQEAMAITEDWLQAYPAINGIICAADVMAIGTINVLNSTNRNHDDFLVVSIDGTREGIRYVKEGALDGTVYMDMEQMVTNVCDIVYNTALGKKYDTFQIYAGAGCIFMVTKDNLDIVTEFDI
jgi:ABC-type sugar transport system substrate-binding protein